jgi:hypothetical protein
VLPRLLCFGLSSAAALLAGCDATLPPPTAAAAVPSAQPQPAPAEPAPAEPAPVKAESIDLLAWIDPRRDVVAGEWTKQDGALLSPDTADARLRLPCTVPAEYRLRAAVERVAGDELFGIGLSAGGRRFLAAFESRYQDRTTSGLELVDGRRLPENSTTHKGRVFQNGRPTTLEATVTKNRVRVTADGKEVTDYRGPFDRLSLQENWSVPEGGLFLASWRCRYRITALELTSLSGEPVELAAGPADAVAAAGAARQPEGTAPEEAKDGAAVEARAAAESVRLADGTVLRLETWNDTYKGYDWREPLNDDDPSIYNVLARNTKSFVLDAEGKKFYWIAPAELTPRGASDGASRRAGQIMRSEMDGVRAKSLLTSPGLYDGRGLSVDPRRRRVYWSEHKPEAGLYRADDDGSDIRRLVGVSPMCTAVNPETGDLYYADDYRIVRVGADGAEEKPVVEIPSTGGPIVALRVYPRRSEIYWIHALGNAPNVLCRSRIDGSEPKKLFYFEGQSFALDEATDKLYWISAGHLWRADLDGTHRESFVEWDIHRPGSPGGAGAIAIDPGSGMLYFSHRVSNDIAGIARMPIPPLLVPHPKPAPPVVTGIDPLVVLPGDEVTLFGRGFLGTEDISMIDTGAGECLTAQFHVRSDTELTATVPKLGDSCTTIPVIVQGGGGLTVTLPMDTHFVPRKAGFDHFANDRTRPYWVEPEPWVPAAYEADRDPLIKGAPRADGGLSNVDGAVVFAAGGYVSSGTRGRNTLFLKNGAWVNLERTPESVVYHEPFARVYGRLRMHPTTRVVPVPAIRPSFLDELLRRGHPIRP